MNRYDIAQGKPPPPEPVRPPVTAGRDVYGKPVMLSVDQDVALLQTEITVRVPEIVARLRIPDRDIVRHRGGDLIRESVDRLYRDVVQRIQLELNAQLEEHSHPDRGPQSGVTGIIGMFGSQGVTGLTGATGLPHFLTAMTGVQGATGFMPNGGETPSQHRANVDRMAQNYGLTRRRGESDTELSDRTIDAIQNSPAVWNDIPSDPIEDIRNTRRVIWNAPVMRTYRGLTLEGNTSANT